MRQRQQMVLGNWKMNGNRESVSQLIAGILEGLSDKKADLEKSCDVVVAPPFPYIAHVNHSIRETFLQLSAQDVSERTEGAYTGEVSASMLVDNGCRFVLIGHSERREYWQESNDTIANKFMAAQNGGLIPVLCVGETQEQRESGQTMTVIASQLNVVIDRLGVDSFHKAAIAYEPVWAIGTGLQAMPDDVQDVHASIRARFATENVELSKSLKVLYGGSVKAESSFDLLKQADVDGALVGGASLDSDHFVRIVLESIRAQNVAE